jgi:hypothetical protein
MQAKSGEERCALGVVLDLFGVAIAVDFDDETEVGAVEVDDVGADGFLAVELVLRELFGSEDFLPEEVFGWGGVLAVGAGELC